MDSHVDLLPTFDGNIHGKSKYHERKKNNNSRTYLKFVLKMGITDRYRCDRAEINDQAKIFMQIQSCVSHFAHCEIYIVIHCQKNE